MDLVRRWDIFYTDSKSGKEGYVDSLTIDHSNKRYILDVDVYAGINQVEQSSVLYSNYVSVLEFINILQKIRDDSYSEIK